MDRRLLENLRLRLPLRGRRRSGLSFRGGRRSSSRGGHRRLPTHLLQRLRLRRRFRAYLRLRLRLGAGLLKDLYGHLYSLDLLLLLMWLLLM